VALLSLSRSITPIGLSVGSFSQWYAAAIIAGVAFMCVLIGHRRTGQVRATLTGLAAGLVFGIQDALTRQTLEILQSSGISSLFTTWAPYALVGAGAIGIQRALGLGSYDTAWTWLHKLRRAMVRPGRDRLAGSVEVDETFWGSEEEGMRGRQTESKALLVIAAQEDGKGIGRIRMRRIPDASAQSLMPFVEDAVETGSLVHTDGWSGYDPLEGKGYRHRITFLKGRKESASDLLPRVHLVASLLKRWLLGTHQGAVSREHLDYYLDEFTFRFNRRKSRSRGKFFLRLAEQAVAVGPSPYKSMVKRYAGVAASDHNIWGLPE